MHVLASKSFIMAWFCVFTRYAALRTRDSHSNDRIFGCVSSEGVNIKSIVILWFKSAISASQLLQSPNTADEFSSDTMNEIHALITQTADAYQEASSSSSPVSICTAYHSRFLRHLVHKDIFKVRKGKRERHVGVPIDPRLQGMNIIIFSCNSPFTW